LCDGYGEVTGVCIAGEHPEDNYDNDGEIPPLDEDDDNDGIPTAFEVAAEALAPNVDGDDIPAWDDLDSDGDILLDEQEGPGDYDNDGIPAIVDLDDFPMTCDSDANCGAADSGVVCNVDVGGYCHPGCRGMAGNGCPEGQTCTSTDDTIGECLGGGEGGGGQGGGGTGGGTGGSPNGSGGGPGAGGSGTGGATDGGDGPADDDCDCSAVGARGSSWGGLVTLGALALLVRRKRR
jgi:clumping factor A